jgi:hypothetical protein
MAAAHSGFSLWHLFLLSFLLWHWSLNLGPHACWAGALPLEDIFYFFKLLGLFSFVSSSAPVYHIFTIVTQVNFSFEQYSKM